MTKLDPNLADRLARFEAAIDRDIAALPLLQLPVRAVLAHIHHFLFVALHGPMLSKAKSEGVAETLASRLGYIVPLITRLKAAPYGRDARDAVLAAREADPDGAQLSALGAYAHVSQFMPEIWRGYYQVEFQSETALRLSHADADFAHREASDILLSELAMPFRFHRGEHRPDPDVATMLQAPPDLFLSLLFATVAKRAQVYAHGQAEVTPVDDAAMNTIFGFDARTFRAIQHAFLGLADVADLSAMFLAAWSLDESDGQTVSDETLEWMSVNLTPELVAEIVRAYSGASRAAIDAFIDAYALDFRTDPPTHRGGDGFFPPFMRGQGTLLFSPILALMSLSSRNAVFGFSEMESRAQKAAARAHRTPPPDRFGAYVANVLEPQLLEQAVSRLPPGHDWQVLRNIPFPGGEIDLVLVDPPNAYAIAFQAKAPLPPQGARMTERLQERVREGFQQIERFDDLGRDRQRAVIEAALHVELPGLRVQHAMLTPACFGADAWARRGGVLLTTPAVIGLAAKRWTAGESLDRFADHAEAVLDDLVEAGAARWEVETVEILDRTITLPLLKYDQAAVDSARELAWPGAPPPPFPLKDFAELMAEGRTGPAADDGAAKAPARTPAGTPPDIPS